MRTKSLGWSVLQHQVIESPENHSKLERLGSSRRSHRNCLSWHLGFVSMQYRCVECDIACFVEGSPLSFVFVDLASLYILE